MVSQSRMCRLLLLALLLSTGTRQALGQAGNQRPLPAKFEVDLRGEPKSRNLLLRGEGVIWEDAGARVSLPGGQGPQRASGLATDFGVEGDFDIIFAYEVIKAEKPDKGYGNGASLYVPIDQKSNNAASMARRITTNGNTIFVSARTQLNSKGVGRAMPSNASKGKMRIERIGKTARFSCMEGDEPDFKILHEIEFSDVPIAYVQVGGNPGGGEGALEIRLLALSIRAERLPGFGGVQAAGGPEPAEEVQRSWTWLYLGGGIAAVFMLLIVILIVSFLLLRGRVAGAKTNAKGSADQSASNQTPVSFVCTECDKPIRVKATAAGKKIKCPHCGHVAAAPGKVRA